MPTISTKIFIPFRKPAGRIFDFPRHETTRRLENAMTAKFRPLRTLAFCAALSAFTSAADAAEIRLIASNAVKEAYSQLLPAYEKASGNKVTVSWGGTADIIKRV